MTGNEGLLVPYMNKMEIPPPWGGKGEGATSLSVIHDVGSTEAPMVIQKGR